MTRFKLSNVVASAEDERDYIYAPLPGPYPVRCPAMLKHVGSIERQGVIGKCTAVTGTTIPELFMTRAGQPLELAPDFNYDFTGAIELRRGLSGRSLRDAIKVAYRWGCPKETLYPTRWDTETTRDPTFECMLDAETRRINRYEKMGSATILSEIMAVTWG